MTANLVDLGYTKTIVGIVLNLVDRELSDTVVKVSWTLHMLLYVCQYFSWKIDSVSWGMCRSLWL